jgi:hypothetical protein
MVDIINISTSRRQEPAPDQIRGRRREAASEGSLSAKLPPTLDELLRDIRVLPSYPGGRSLAQEEGLLSVKELLVNIHYPTTVRQVL